MVIKSVEKKEKTYKAPVYEFIKLAEKLEKEKEEFAQHFKQIVKINKWMENDEKWRKKMYKL